MPGLRTFTALLIQFTIFIFEGTRWATSILEIARVRTLVCSSPFFSVLLTLPSSLSRGPTRTTRARPTADAPAATSNTRSPSIKCIAKRTACSMPHEKEKKGLSILFTRTPRFVCSYSSLYGPRIIFQVIREPWKRVDWLAFFFGTGEMLQLRLELYAWFRKKDISFIWSKFHLILLTFNKNFSFRIYQNSESSKLNYK